MKPPSFWYHPPGIYSTLLQPLGWLYEKGGILNRHLTKTHSLPIPILSVGNLVCGGAGKTPTAIAIARLLKEKGILAHFVTRGYGGEQKGPLEVDPNVHSPFEVGDEALLLAREAPTWIAKKRPLGVKKAIERGAHCIILDDGHQTVGLHKDLSFVVVDSLQGFGNSCVMPAGPLRESLLKGFARTDALIGLGKEERAPSLPFFKAATLPQPLLIPSKRVFAFCGLGFPQKFYQTLEKAGFQLVATQSFPDHYVYKKEDLDALYKAATKQNALLVTTRKDRVKIPPTWQIPVYVLDITIQFEDPEGIYRFILDKIPSLKEEA